jgi:2-phosphosulfolactate phosphatase
MPKIEVVFSPALYIHRELEDSIVVIIDILRATSAICTGFEFGVKEFIPVATVEEAQAYKKQGYLVGAERNAIKLEWADFGNSPYDYMGDHVKDKTIVLTTTNGTQAVEVAKDAYKVVIGSFLNISALCNWLVKQDKDLVLLCSGWKYRFNLEDALFAGAVVTELTKRKAYDGLTDSALSVRYLYELAKDDPYKFLANSSHRRRLAKLNLKKDIRYCLQLDKTSIIPILQGTSIVKLEEVLA